VPPVEDTDQAPEEPPPEPLAPELDCDDDALLQALSAVRDWSTTTSCGHLWFSAVDDNAQWGVQIHIETRDRVMEVGRSFEHDFAAPGSQTAWLLLHRGTDIAPACVDGSEGDLPVLSRTWRAGFGNAAFTVTDVSTDTGTTYQSFTATLEIQDVVLSEVGGQETTCALPDAVWIDLPMGWYVD
jgi:hypothetical protein